MQEFLKRNTFELYIEDTDEILKLDNIRIENNRDSFGYVNSFSLSCHYLNESYEVKKALKYDKLINLYNDYYVKKKDIVSDGELYEIDCYTGKQTKILEVKNLVLSSINEFEQIIDLYCDWCIATGNHSNNIETINYQPTFRPQTINTYDDEEYDDNMMLTNNVNEYCDDYENDIINNFEKSYNSIHNLKRAESQSSIFGYNFMHSWNPMDWFSNKKITNKDSLFYHD